MLEANSLQPISPASFREKPANVSETTAILSRLLSSFPERESDDGSKLDRLRSYVIALEGYSLPVLEECERRILKAKAPDLDPRFMPTPPQLARLCGDIRASRLCPLPSPRRAEPDIVRSPRVTIGLQKLSAILAAAPRSSDAHFDERRREIGERLGKLREGWRR